MLELWRQLKGLARQRQRLAHEVARRRVFRELVARECRRRRRGAPVVAPAYRWSPSGPLRLTAATAAGVQ